MNTYRKKNYRGKRGYSGRPHRRSADSYHQPLPPDQTRIPYARHTLTKPDVEAVVEALLSGNLTQGRELERFESLLAKLTHSEHAIAMSSGTAAIHAALACLKLEPEDEVITSTLNFSSVANMITLVGATPVLADIDPNTLTLSAETVQAVLTPNTKAVFTNNFGGHPSDLQAIRAICDEHNLVLIEDASHGLGGKYRGHYVGNQADLTCFSFHPSKAITTCEGGAVTTNNRAQAEWVRLFRHHGIQKDSRYFQSDENYPSYYQELQFLGMNYRMSELHAALGRSQLTRLDRHIERRRSIAQVYFQKLGSVEELVLPYVADWADNAYHLYPIQFVGELEGKRDEIFNDLKSAGIDVQVHYVPVHRMPVYEHVLGEPSDFPNAENYFSRAISLPLFPDLSYKELERITELIIKFVSKHLSRPLSTEDNRDDAGNEAARAAFDDQDSASDQFDTNTGNQAEDTDDDESDAKAESEESKPEPRSRRSRSRRGSRTRRGNDQDNSEDMASEQNSDYAQGEATETAPESVAAEPTPESEPAAAPEPVAQAEPSSEPPVENAAAAPEPIASEAEAPAAAPQSEADAEPEAEPKKPARTSRLRKVPKAAAKDEGEAAETKPKRTRAKKSDDDDAAPKRTRRPRKTAAEKAEDGEKKPARKPRKRRTKAEIEADKAAAEAAKAAAPAAEAAPKADSDS